jgi:hypothetical protein
MLVGKNIIIRKEVSWAWKWDCDLKNCLQTTIWTILQNQCSRDDHTIDYAKFPIYQYLKISCHWNSISVIIHLLQITFFATSWWCCKLCINKIHKIAQHSAAIPDTLNDVQNSPCAPSISTWFKKWNQTGFPTKQDSSAAEGDTKRRKSQLIPNHLSYLQLIIMQSTHKIWSIDWPLECNCGMACAYNMHMGCA